MSVIEKKEEITIISPECDDEAPNHEYVRAIARAVIKAKNTPHSFLVLEYWETDLFMRYHLSKRAYRRWRAREKADWRKGEARRQEMRNRFADWEIGDEA